MKRRYTFMVDPDVLAQLKYMAVRTGLSQSEQIRQGICWWLQSREWPTKGDHVSQSTLEQDASRAARGQRRGPTRRP